jgi:hypothetical protein
LGVPLQNKGGMMSKNKKIAIGIATTFAGIAVFLFLWLKSNSAPISRPEEEQKVNSVVLADFVYQVEEYTTIGLIGDDLNGSLAYIAEEMPTLRKETMLDFQKNNEQAYLLKNYLPTVNDDILLSTNDIQGLPKNDGWITLSRVGFNSKYTQALVLLGQVAKVNGDIIICNEIFEILQKTGDTWIMQSEVRVMDCELPPSKN